MSHTTYDFPSIERPHNVRAAPRGTFFGDHPRLAQSHAQASSLSALRLVVSWIVQHDAGPAHPQRAAFCTIHR
ncbi:hypothetical protein R0J87_23660, partial [Halomonas sp. SIMBA_159]